MKCIFILFLILPILVSGQSSNYKWGTERIEIVNHYNLSKFELKPLEENLKTFLSPEEENKFCLYMVDDMKFENICDVNLFKVMGFYQDSLFFYFQATQERAYSEKDDIAKCIRKVIFGDLIKFRWKVNFKRKSEDGDIFWEGGYVGFGESKTEYYVSLHSLGTITNPSHSQYTFFTFSRRFLDYIKNKRMNIHPENKSKLHPTELFTKYLVDDYSLLSEPFDD
jgi:hypothetical protein